MASTGPIACPGRVLVVEDDPAAARFACYVLGERGGFDVAHVPDPVVALQRIADEHWDLVLADLDLPHMSGLDLLASVRRAAPGLPVVLTTARAMDAVHTHALLLHADAFLDKPIAPRRLIVVARALAASGRGSGRGSAVRAETPGTERPSGRGG
ncbi:MAG TPA: response regulator [Streptosporangiaceae bacterium]|nr:response regulator [Streptosporangiaceae bacterium]